MEAPITVNPVWKIARLRTSVEDNPIISERNHINGCIRTNQINAANELNVTCTVATCFCVLVPVNHTIIDVNDVPIWAPNIIVIATGRGISPVLKDAITIVLVAVLDWIIIVRTIPRSKNHILGRSRYKDRSKASLTITILSFIIPRPNNNNQNQNKNNDAAFNFFFFPKINNENHPKTIRGSAIAEISILKPKKATIQEVVVVPILAQITVPIAQPRSIILAQTNHKTITVTIVLLCKTPEAIDQDKIPFNGVFVVLRRSLFNAILPTSLMLSEKTCIPKRNILNHHNNSRQENTCSI